MIFFNRQKKVREIITKIKKRNKLKELIYLNIGCLIVALAFNIFFSPYNLV